MAAAISRYPVPELNDLPMSDPVDYALGDVTIHSHLTVHGAGSNQMDRPRWAYLVLPQPADARCRGGHAPVCRAD